jgi:DNA-binding response OmpR family regulator
MEEPYLTILLVLSIFGSVVLIRYLWRRDRPRETIFDIRIGDSFLDMRSSELVHGPDRVQLSVREAGFLVFLRDLNGQILEYEEIKSTLWVDEEFSIDRLEDFVYGLRSKVKLDPKIKIEKISGMGYRLGD